MEVTPAITIPEDELQFTFARSGGPGGQNVNKVESKAVLRFDLTANTSLPPGVRDRLRGLAANRITAEGELVITSQRFRDQGRNVEDCLAKLRELVLRALVPPKTRKKTRPGRGAKERRLADKRQQSRRKEGRRRPSEE